MDRLLAIWQKLHPGKWVTEQFLGDSTLGDPLYLLQNGNTPLLPFLRDEKHFWTSNDCEDITKLYGNQKPVVRV
jgi:hypothetical protein